MRVILAAIATAAALAAGPALGAPTWEARPNGDDLLKQYPDFPMKIGLAGRAVMECKFNGKGALTGCAAAEETPTGVGFGQAVVALASKFRATPASAPEGSMVRIPVRFAIGDPSPTEVGAEACYGALSKTAEPAVPETAVAYWTDQFKSVLAKRYQGKDLETRMEQSRKADRRGLEAMRAACIARAAQG